MQKQIIFIHIPKTGGTSLRYGVLRAKKRPVHEIVIHYGGNPKISTEPYREMLGSDEGRRQFAREMEGKSFFLCGHLHAKDFTADFDPACFATFLRHPVNRVLSGFQNHLKRGSGGPLEKYIRRRRFCNLQSKRLEGLDLREMGFVGLTENFNEDLPRFREYSGIDAKLTERNRKRYKAVEDPAILKEIEELNAEDMALYERALGMLGRSGPPCPQKKRAGWMGRLFSS